MPLEPTLIFELAALGIVTGFLAGLLGIGGGMIMVPAMAWLLEAKHAPAEHVIKMAVATSLATICITSISSVRAHHARGAVLWSVAASLAPGIVLGSLIASQIAVAVPGKALSLLFAIFVAFSATQMLLDRKPKATRTLPGALGLFGAGLPIGGLSALVGAGGAFISVPFMTWCNVNIHKAVGTSAALGFPIAAAGTAGYLWATWGMQGLPPGSLGYLYLPALVVVSIASFCTAPLGARLAHAMDIRPLKRAFAFVLYALAAYFLLR